MVGPLFEAWDDDKRVAIIGSGGLSHFLVDKDVDKDIDWMARDAMNNKGWDAPPALALPHHRLYGVNLEA